MLYLSIGRTHTRHIQDTPLYGLLSYIRRHHSILYSTGVKNINLHYTYHENEAIKIVEIYRA